MINFIMLLIVEKGLDIVFALSVTSCFAKNASK